MDHDNLYASFSLPAGDFVAGLLQIFICLGPVVQKLVNFNPGLALTLG
jgi:hypothetical protein